MKAHTLSQHAPETQLALRTGIGPGGTRWIAREWIAPDRVVFEELERAPTRPGGIGPWLLAIRAFSLTATLTPGLAVALWLHSLGVALDWISGVCGLLGVIGLQVATNVFNDVADYERLIDLPGTQGGSGVIQSGWWTPAALTRLAWVSLSLGAVAGATAMLRQAEAAWWVLGVVALMGGLGALAYSNRPAGFKYRALGDLLVLLLCGPALVIGFALVWGGDPSLLTHPGLWAIGGVFGLLATALLHLNNLQDMILDASRGATTFALKLGYSASQRYAVALYLLSAVIVIAAAASGGVSGLPRGVALGLVPLALLSVPLSRSVLQASGPDSPLLAGARMRAAQIHLATGLAICAGMLFG